VPKRDALLDRMRQICLALPDTKETLTWGKPHFRVADKIFCGCDDESGRPVIGFKLEMEHARAIVQDPRFWKAPYVGHKGWVSMDVTSVRDWEEVRALVTESYRLIAPKKSLAKLLGAATDLPQPRTGKRAPKTTVRRRPSRPR